MLLYNIKEMNPILFGGFFVDIDLGWLIEVNDIGTALEMRG